MFPSLPFHPLFSHYMVHYTTTLNYTALYFFYLLHFTRNTTARDDFDPSSIEMTISERGIHPVRIPVTPDTINEAAQVFALQLSVLGDIREANMEADFSLITIVDDDRKSSHLATMNCTRFHWCVHMHWVRQSDACWQWSGVGQVSLHWREDKWVRTIMRDIRKKNSVGKKARGRGK